MNILFHTIALEPARWTPQRVSQNLADLIPKIARAGFQQIEIYEPHLALGDEDDIRKLLAQYQLSPVVLSSYLQVAPEKTDGEKFVSEKYDLIARVRRFGFRKVRLFPGMGVSPKDAGAVEIVARRVAQIAGKLPDVEILLETHDGSIADEPEAVAALVGKTGCANVGLLYQPAIFQPEPALKQLAAQKHFIRHVHLQNRFADGSFSPLREGVVPWDKILPQLNVDVSIEFVASGICTVEEFDLAKSIAEAVLEADYVRSL